MNTKLLEILACPNCTQKVEYLKPSNQLVCKKCMLSYKIKDEIPVMLLEEAEKVNLTS